MKWFLPLGFGLLAACASAPTRPVLPPAPIIENDLPAALSRARAENVPLVVVCSDAERTYSRRFDAQVFPSQEFAESVQGTVVLRLDVTDPANDDFLQRFNVEDLPVLVLDPRSGTLLSRSVVGLALDAAAVRGVVDLARRAQGGSLSATERELLEAQRSYGVRDFHTAARGFASVVSTRGVESHLVLGAAKAWLGALDSANDDRACAQQALKWAPSFSGRDRLSLLSGGYSCLWGRVLEPEDEALRLRLAETLERERNAAALEPQPVWVQYLLVLTARERKDWDEAKRRASALVDHILRERAAAPSAKQRTEWLQELTFTARDSGRLEAVVGLFEESERELPEDLYVKHWLAWAYVLLNRDEDALSTIERAAPLATGGRRLRVEELRARTLKSMSRSLEANAVAKAALEEARRLPRSQQTYFKSTIESLEWISGRR
ncbi:hypothetical protein P2318_32665 [Myxococcaceae bacterium GXIMD 01537]